MKLVQLPLAATVVALATVSYGYAQTAPFDRLSVDRFEVMPPSERVRGDLGSLTVRQQACIAEPGRDVRRHIVNVVVQEWAYFGFSVVDETDPENWVRRRPREANANGADAPELRALAQARVEEAARVAPSIAGYWAVTREGGWVIDRQNEAWNRSDGNTSRWVEPWSAAFISWVMCEAGFEESQFRRAIAHHVYIDQAIRARDGEAPEAAFVAHDAGEKEIVPGDLLCAARRPAYRRLADRRAQMGMGARTHCDVVVKVDEEQALLLAIGGNVRGTVGLKLLPAQRAAGGYLRPVDRSSVPGARSAFAHLKLRADPIEASALDSSPTMAALRCTLDGEPATRVVTANAAGGVVLSERC
jgi:hypothetical protein